MRVCYIEMTLPTHFSLHFSLEKRSSEVTSQSRHFLTFRHGALLRRFQSKYIIYSVHCAGPSDVQNILPEDTGISHHTEGHSFGDHLSSESVWYKLLLCSGLCLYDSCESMSNQPALWTPDSSHFNINILFKEEILLVANAFSIVWRVNC
jgi:hypothetical protein